MTVYILRYASEGETSHINEGFRTKTVAIGRFKQLKGMAEGELKTFKKEGGAYETAPIEMFNGPLENYLREVTVNTIDDLIKLINTL